MSETSGNSRSIMSEMDKTEAEIKSSYHRLDVLERNLKYRPMTNDEREQTEKDVRDLRKVLKNLESQLSDLRRGNRSSVFVAVVLIVLIFLIFGIYHMYLNVKKDESVQFQF